MTASKLLCFNELCEEAALVARGIYHMAFEKAATISKYKGHESDTGSARVQIAVLTDRINYLADHFKSNPKDHHGKRGRLKMVGKRRRLLEYLKRSDVEGYRQIIGELGLRH